MPDASLDPALYAALTQCDMAYHRYDSITPTEASRVALGATRQHRDDAVLAAITAARAEGEARARWVNSAVVGVVTRNGDGAEQSWSLDADSATLGPTYDMTAMELLDALRVRFPDGNVAVEPEGEDTAEAETERALEREGATYGR